MSDLGGNLVPNPSHFLEYQWRCHGPASSPSNSIGVTSSGVQPKYTINPSDLPELVRVGQMLAIPGYEEIATMVRGKGQMQRVAEGIGRHKLVCQIGLDDFKYGII